MQMLKEEETLIKKEKLIPEVVTQVINAEELPLKLQTKMINENHLLQRKRSAYSKHISSKVFQ